MQQYSLTSSGQVQSSHRFLIGPPLIAVLIFGFGFVLLQSHNKAAITEPVSTSQATEHASTDSVSTKKVLGLHKLSAKPAAAAPSKTLPGQLTTRFAAGPTKITSLSTEDYAPASTANPQSLHSTATSPQPAASNTPATTKNSSPFGLPVDPSHIINSLGSSASSLLK